MIANEINAHTILFTEDCPLDCRYCQLKLEEDYHTYPTKTFDSILQKVEEYVEADKKNNKTTQLTFTGGEPFLYWEWIDKIIDKYKDTVTYHFNTCGYCFTEDILEKLSHYKTFFTLSIDGGEKLTNYMRPVKGNKYHIGYFDKIKEITPFLVYYFPNVEAKVIVNNRTVDLLYETYLDLEAVGFKKIKFILDFNARPAIKGTKKEIQKTWDDNDTNELKKQLDLLVEELLLRCSFNKNFMRIQNMDKIIGFLLKNIKEYSPDNLECKVFNGRTLSVLANDKDSSCFDGLYNNLEDARNALIEEFNKLNGKCPLDENCEAFLFCANTHCPVSSYQDTNSLFGSDFLECILDKLFYEFCLKFIAINNELNSENKIYIQYLNQFYFKEKEELLNGNILSFF